MRDSTLTRDDSQGVTSSNNAHATTWHWSTWHGERFGVEDVVAEPKGIQRLRISIIVGGNGQKVTWRLAARFADELNLDGPTLDEIREWLLIIRQRCEEVDRGPATLPLSAEIWWTARPA